MGQWMAERESPVRTVIKAFVILVTTKGAVAVRTWLVALSQNGLSQNGLSQNGYGKYITI